MKKIVLSILGLVSMSTTLMAQEVTKDSAITLGGTTDVYYSFENGEVGTAPRDGWHLGFTTNNMDASILTNGALGVELYVASEDVSDYDNLDTTGMDWTALYNSEQAWELGAFIQPATGHPDYGWGKYTGTHDVKGSKVFVLLYDDVYYKIVIEGMLIDGTVSFKMVQLDGSNEVTPTFTKGDFNSKNFYYYNIETNQWADLEPAKDAWDMLFTKYITPIPTGPGTFLNYPVSGVKTNIGYQVAQREGVAVEENDQIPTYETDITVIGSDWKSFDFNQMTYLIQDSLTYFVENTAGEIYKVWFTDYTLGTSNYHFSFEKVKTSSVEELGENKLDVTLYPNPASEELNVLYNFNSAQNAQLEISSIDGQSVYKSQLTGNGFTQKVINISHLSNGLYILKVANGEQLYTAKFVIK